jgi:hypothetical protein
MVPKPNASFTPCAEAKMEATSSEGSMGVTIPPADHKSQYRALGIVVGQFLPSDEDVRQGMLLTPDGLSFPARSAFPRFRPKRHQLEQAIAWRVWPRPDREAGLRFALKAPCKDENGELITETEEHYSIRGQLKWWKADEGKLAISIRPNKNALRRFNPYFLILQGHVPNPRAGAFWEIEAGREGRQLALLDGQEALPPKQNKQRKNA